MLICQLTDLHVRAAGPANEPEPKTNSFTRQACRVAGAFTPRPDMVIITGDLTDHGLDAEYACLSEILADTLPMPVYVIPGNHDDRERLRTSLAHLPGIASDSRFVRYVIEHEPVRIVMLDTLVANEAYGSLTDEQLEWLDLTLAARPSCPTMIGMHHPPIISGIPHMDMIGLRDAAAFRGVIAGHPQVERIVCGHQHRPVIGTCAQAIVSIAPSVGHQVALTFDPANTGAFNFEPPALHLHTWTVKNGFVSHTIYTADYPGPFYFQPEESGSKTSSRQDEAV